MTTLPKLILASASPRRKELLESVGLPFDVVPADISEDPRPHESAHELVSRLAREKAAALAHKFPDAVVIGADTIVVLREDAPAADVLGKPVDKADAARMLRLLSGNTHFVLTAVSVCCARENISSSRTVKSAVTFRALTDKEVEAYVASREPYDKAGGYGVQGIAGAFVTGIDGSYTNVVGLPVAELREELAKTGLWKQLTR